MWLSFDLLDLERVEIWSNEKFITGRIRQISNKNLYHFRSFHGTVDINMSATQGSLESMTIDKR